MSKKHIIISGTGRAGTTFLVQLFTSLGLDTGFANNSTGVHQYCNAGMELDIRDPNAPYIVKTPWFCVYLDEVLANNDIIIEHAIIPMRDLYSAAESRRHVTNKMHAGNGPLVEVPGGLWQTDKPEQQEQVLTFKYYNLMYTLAKHDIPVTLLLFPRIIHDPDYLHRKISFLMNGVSVETFRTVFAEIAQPRLVHDFQNEDRKDGVVKS